MRRGKPIPPGMRRVAKSEKGWMIHLEPMRGWSREEPEKPTYEFMSDRNLIESTALDAIRKYETLTITIGIGARVWEEDEAIP